MWREWSSSYVAIMPMMTRALSPSAVAPSAAPAPLLVQYALDDTLFTQKGMRDADAVIRGYYARAGTPDAYRAEFFNGPHRFDAEMQAVAFRWLKANV